MRFSLLIPFLAAALCAADLTPQQRQLNVDSFEYAWKTIGNRMWEPMPAGVDWQKVHDELLPKVRDAKTMTEARAVMQDMVGRLKLTHFGIVPGDVYDAVEVRATGDGTPGFDLRILDGAATVTTVDADSPAAKAGIKPGWQIVSVEGKAIEPVLAKIRDAYKTRTTLHLTMVRVVLAMFSGPRGENVESRVPRRHQSEGHPIVRSHCAAWR